MKNVNGASGVTTTGQKVCHVKIADVAKAAAGELYENMMSNNVVYNEWRKQNPGCNEKELEARFIKKNWGSCIDFARTTLTLMLTRDDVADTTKDEIMVILEQDQVLRDKRTAHTPFRKVH
jgi:ABC-type uncharacterized transport system YnjBCD substrate-binding protein